MVTILEQFKQLGFTEEMLKTAGSYGAFKLSNGKLEVIGISTLVIDRKVRVKQSQSEEAKLQFIEEFGHEAYYETVERSRTRVLGSKVKELALAQ